MASSYELDDSQVHYAWDNSINTRITIEPGDTIRFTTRDSGDYYYTKDSTNDDVINKGPLVGHPLTGPVYVKDAEAGDMLAITVKDVTPSKDFGWTAIRPGKGLLPQTEFPEHFLQIWELGDNGYARMKQRDDIAIPVAPFPGIMGTALPEPGEHSTIPPRKNGGNMDLKHLCQGATLYLPVFVEGGLFCVGDAHAAQGDGEVCITAIEMAAYVTLTIDLIKGKTIQEPQCRTRHSLNMPNNASEHFVTTANGPDLHHNAQSAVRYMIEHLVQERNLSREEAYVLCSVCVDLKITEIVDSPNWMVAAFLPECVFV